MSQHILSMQPLRAISMAICLLFTSLFLFSCEEEELYRNPFEGQWRTMLLDDYGRRIVGYYAFDSNGYGTYTLYREGFYAEPLESSRFRYDYDRFAIEIRYETGARDRFQYFSSKATIVSNSLIATEWGRRWSKLMFVFLFPIEGIFTAFR